MSDAKIIPACKNDSEHQLTATGHWVPCCNVPQYGKQFQQLPFSSDHFKVGAPQHIHRFHKDPEFIKWITDIETGAVPAPKFCKLKCSQKVIDLKQDNPFIITNGQEIEYG